ncbi:OmpA family protein [Formosa sp. PL04]|uniref:OmpA family protein n=1 Tax=Formosa sp. PL04 TaxID=3081755 RepID=UPI002981444C|nr:OmpA family protein [Formosa sp. PL04]MDW5289572.1 OmpA family protein [Formosa sp. PL04]
MILKKEILFIFFVAITLVTYSQTSEIKDFSEITEITEIDSTRVSFWMVGIGFNAVDDSGNVFDGIFDTDGSWNAVPYPSRVSIGRYFKSGLGVEGIFTYNLYKKGKMVDNYPLEEDVDYYSVDSRLSYDLNRLVGETGWFDPYLGAGVGFTHANKNTRGTYNAVLGFRVWFSERFGMDVNATGKWGINYDFRNHKQYAIGAVYKFDIKKELTKKDQLAVDEALELDQIRVEDSIARVNMEQEEAMLLAQQLAQQKAAAEQERLAQLENEKIEARNKVQSEIDGLDNLYFAFDSSTLNSDSITILDELLLILNENPEIMLGITSHTDSRGSAAYNQTLSEKRLKSTLDYLFENGIETNRIEGKAYGESKLINECDGNTKCSESKHRENRRSEINIVTL